MAERKSEQQQSERKQDQQQEASRDGGKQEEATRQEAERAARETERMTREATDQGRQTMEAASDATRRMAEESTSALGAQTQQATELAKGLMETQSEAMEVAMMTLDNATDVGTTSAQIWASYSSAWIDMVRRLMQFQVENVRRLRESGGFVRAFEAQGDLVRETMNTWSQSQSKMVETARRSADDTGRQLQRAR